MQHHNILLLSFVNVNSREFNYISIIKRLLLITLAVKE